MEDRDGKIHCFLSRLTTSFTCCGIHLLASVSSVHKILDWNGDGLTLVRIFMSVGRNSRGPFRRGRKIRRIAWGIRSPGADAHDNLLRQRVQTS